MIKEEDRIKMSFGFAADVAKQLIALSTAIITICVALADKLFSSQAIKNNSTLLLIALGLFVISIIVGLLCMMAITGTLGKPKTNTEETHEEEATGGVENATENAENPPVPQDPNEGTIYQSNISTLMKVQIFLFLGGIIMSVVFLCAAAFSNPSEEGIEEMSRKQEAPVVRVKRTSSYSVVDSVGVDTLVINAYSQDKVEGQK